MLLFLLLGGRVGGGGGRGRAGGGTSVPAKVSSSLSLPVSLSVYVCVFGCIACLVGCGGWVGGGGRGITWGWVRLTGWKRSVRLYMWECVCVLCVCVCVLALLVGVGSHGQYPRTLHQTPKNMFVFFCSWMLRALGVGYFSLTFKPLKFDPFANPAIPHLLFCSLAKAKSPCCCLPDVFRAPNFKNWLLSKKRPYWILFGGHPLKLERYRED